MLRILMEAVFHNSNKTVVNRICFFSAKFYSILYKTKTVFNLKNVLHFTLIVINSKIAKFGPKMRKITTAKITTVKQYTLGTLSHIYT